MEQPMCVIVAPLGVNLYLAIAVLTGLAVVLYLLWQDMHGEPVRVFDYPPVAIDLTSPISVLMLSFGFLSLHTPLGAAIRIFQNNPRLLSLISDIHVLLWLLLAWITFFNPPLAPVFAPLFFGVWSHSYLTTLTFNLIIQTAGLQETSQGMRIIGYRVLGQEALAYMTVWVFSAALFRANPTYLGQRILSARDALYFSEVTITTTGYGEITAQGCLRWVVMWEIGMGVFLVVVVIAMAIGIIVSQLTGSRSAQ